MYRVSRWCYKSASLKVIGQFRREAVGCETGVKFCSSHWSVLVSFDPSIGSQTKLICLTFICQFYLCRVYVVCKVS